MKRVVFSIIVCFALSACALDSSPQYAHVEPAYRQQTVYRSQITYQQKVNQDCRNYYQNHSLIKKLLVTRRNTFFHFIDSLS